MDTKSSVIIGAGITVATIVGISVAVIQNRPTSDSPSSRTISPPATLTPSPTATVSPTAPEPSPETIPSPTITPPSSPKTEAPVKEPSRSDPIPSPKPPRSKPSRQIEQCLITMAKVADPNPPLNVRSAPTVASNNIVGQLPNNTYVTVATEKEGWLQITDPVSGWIAKNRTESSCSTMTVRLNFAPGSSQMTVSDRFIGTGNHRYRVAAAEGQTITLNSLEGPLPVVIGPEGKAVLSAADDQFVLKGTLPSTGDYILDLNSNYKGFEYSFVVKIE